MVYPSRLPPPSFSAAEHNLPVLAPGDQLLYRFGPRRGKEAGAGYSPLVLTFVAYVDTPPRLLFKTYERDSKRIAIAGQRRPKGRWTYRVYSSTWWKAHARDFRLRRRHASTTAGSRLCSLIETLADYVAYGERAAGSRTDYRQDQSHEWFVEWGPSYGAMSASELKEVLDLSHHLADLASTQLSTIEQRRAETLAAHNEAITRRASYRRTSMENIRKWIRGRARPREGYTRGKTSMYKCLVLAWAQGDGSVSARWESKTGEEPIQLTLHDLRRKHVPEDGTMMAALFKWAVVDRDERGPIKLAAYVLRGHVRCEFRGGVMVRCEVVPIEDKIRCEVVPIEDKKEN